MRRALVPFLLVASLAPTARAFEWDDGRGAFPFRPTTTRQYEVVRDLDHMSRFRRADYGMDLARRIRARAPGATGAGAGAATARFHIDASGAIDALRVISASTPAHADALRGMLLGLRAPPPPGGSFDAVQTIRFH
jgi:hypothetical protein